MIRTFPGASGALFVAGLALLITATVLQAAAVATPHGGNGSGQPYNNGQIQSNNYTFYTTEASTAMNNWQTATGRRFIDGWTSGETMTQYVVYTSSQQDLDLASWFGVNSCHYWANNGYSGVRAFEFGHHSKNNDKQYTVVCLNVTALGWPVGYDQVNLTTRKRGMTHEMGHALHLGPRHRRRDVHLLEEAPACRQSASNSGTKPS